MAYAYKRAKQPDFVVKHRMMEQKHHRMTTDSITRTQKRSHERKLQYERMHIGNEWMNAKPYTPQLRTIAIGLRRKQPWASTD